MKKMIIALLCLAANTAVAKSVSLPKLLLNGDYANSSIRYPQGYILFYLQQPTTSGNDLLTEVSYFGDNENPLGAYNSLRLTIEKPFLFSGDLKILKKNVILLSQNCFNLSDSRNNEINMALDKFNQLPLVDKKVKIGPMELVFHRFAIRSSEQPITLVLLSRDGIPGKEPWLNYCTA